MQTDRRVQGILHQPWNLRIKCSFPFEKVVKWGIDIGWSASTKLPDVEQQRVRPISRVVVMVQMLLLGHSLTQGSFNAHNQREQSGVYEVSKPGECWEINRFSLTSRQQKWILKAHFSPLPIKGQEAARWGDVLCWDVSTYKIAGRSSGFKMLSKIWWIYWLSSRIYKVEHCCWW
jgi:hypothetical protein